MSKKRLCFVGNHNDVINYAASELKKYIEKISSCNVVFCENAEDADFILGMEELPYSKWDDSILLESRKGKLFLAGSNPRSVLFAVYDYLHERGCRWPNPADEFLPENVEIRLDGFKKFESASCRYRGLSAFSPGTDDEAFAYAYRLIDWMPKHKYNLFFMEGFSEECPGDEWLESGVHPLQHVEHSCVGWSWEDRVKYAKRRSALVEHARSLGLLIERYGHGWAAGIIEHYAQKYGMDIASAHERLRAKGKLSHEAGECGEMTELATSTMWFQFCMSARGVKELYIEHTVNYLRKHHNEIDIAAFWLGDGYDNACQCPECIKRPFSDWYLEILEAIAREAKTFAPELRIEGLVYFMTLEPPQGKYLENCSNVDFIIAPWDRCYRHRMDDPSCSIPGWTPDYRNNKSCDFSRNCRPLNADMKETLAGWKKNVFEFKCRMFEYFSLYSDPGRHRLAYNALDLARDIRDYRRLGIDGCVSCEPVSYIDAPFFLVHNVAGAMMWNNSLDAETLRQELLKLYSKSDTETERLIAVADQVNDIFLNWNEHGLTENTVLEQMSSELMLFSEDTSLPKLFRYDLMTVASLLENRAGKQAVELQIQQEIRTFISSEESFFRRYFDCRKYRRS